MRGKKLVCKERGNVVTEAVQMSKFEDLPLDVLLSILSRLPISVLHNVKLVRRLWYKLARNLRLIGMQGPCVPQDDPCLILHSDSPVPNRLYAAYLFANNESPGMVREIDVPELPWFDVVGSCNGWLCLRDSKTRHEFHVYNPTTGQYSLLPEPNRRADKWTVFGYGVKPESNDFKVVKISASRSRHHYPLAEISDVEVLDIGSSSWRNLGEVPYHLMESPSQIVVYGRLHWVDWPSKFSFTGLRRKLVAFDLSGETFVEVPKPFSAGLNWCCHELVVLRECLSAAVYIKCGKYDIWIMKQYGVRESWIKEYSFDFASHVPRGLEADVDDLFDGSSFYLQGSYVRVLGQLRNGDILLAYHCRALACYNPETKTFYDVTTRGMPSWFQAFHHVTSASSILPSLAYN